MIVYVFLIISAVGLISALGAVLAKNLIHAALYLVAFFFTIACQFVLLEAEFLAAVQVLIYIGAVAILLLFGIMLTRNIQGDETTTVTWLTRALGAVVGLAIFGVLVMAIGEERGYGGRPSWSRMSGRPIITTPKADSGEATSLEAESLNNMGRVIGRELMTRYVIAFEVAGLLLTAAVVGAIAVAMLEGADDPDRDETIPAARSGTVEGPDGGPFASRPETLLTSSTPASRPR